MADPDKRSELYEHGQSLWHSSILFSNLGFAAVTKLCSTRPVSTFDNRSKLTKKVTKKSHRLPKLTHIEAVRNALTYTYKRSKKEDISVDLGTGALK